MGKTRGGTAWGVAPGGDAWRKCVGGMDAWKAWMLSSLGWKRHAQDVCLFLELASLCAVHVRCGAWVAHPVQQFVSLDVKVVYNRAIAMELLCHLTVIHTN